MVFKQVDILGVSFVDATRDQFVTQLHTHIEREEKKFIVTANPEIVMKANRDEVYRETIAQADYVTADGIGVVKAAQLLKTPLPERITGYDVLLDLLALADEHRYRVYLLGASVDTLEKAAAHVATTYKHVQLVGSHHGFFDWDDRSIQAEIAEQQADIIFLALGVPRQEQWIAENIASFTKGIFIGVGGSFDVLAGTVKRAPVAWQKANLEWLYRIIKQPSRWKRSLALPAFVCKVIGQKVTGRR